jgi:hypothetical protein
MASKSFYKQYFEGAEVALNPPGIVENPFGNMGASCPECDSSHVKILFEAKGSQRISVFLHCQDCRHRASI